MSPSPVLRFLAASALSILPAGAAITVTSSTATHSSQTYFSASATDLVNQGQATFTSQWVSGYTPFSGSNTNALNNGAVGAVNSLADSAIDLSDGAWTSIFHLDTAAPSHAEGYQITRIVTLAAWDGDRISQVYNIYYSTIASNPTNGNTTGFTLLDSESYVAYQSAGGSSQITIDITGLTGVNAIRFDSLLPWTTDAAVYREIDVFGTGVPEPASLALLALGGLGVLRRRR
ncbi:MAG: PEP-CTERM sorting domain-containing protein [Lentisphaeria bacterium]